MKHRFARPLRTLLLVALGFPPLELETQRHLFGRSLLVADAFGRHLQGFYVVIVVDIPSNQFAENPDMKFYAVYYSELTQ